MPRPRCATRPAPARAAIQPPRENASTPSRPRFPELADHAGALAAQGWLDAGRAPEAEASARAALERVPDSGIAAELFAALGRARLEQGDAKDARAAWREALARGPDEAVADAMRLELAASLVAADEIDAAAAELRTLWIDAAERAAGAEAGRRLDALDTRAGRPLRTPADRVRHADRLFEKQRSEAALAAYDTALAAGIPGADRRRAERRRADCLFRLRRYREAETAFGALGADPDARVWQARALARSDRVDEAIEPLEAIGRESLGRVVRLGALSRRAAGRGARTDEQARALFAAAVDGADEKVAAQALWRLGWSAYLRGEMRHGAPSSAGAGRRSTPIRSTSSQARYWAARALEAEEPAEAARELAEIAAGYPFSYYGWRAAAAWTRRRSRARRSPTAARDSPRATCSRRACSSPPDSPMPASGHCAARRARRERGRSRRTGVGSSSPAGDDHRAQSLLVAAYAEPLARGVAPGQEDAVAARVAGRVRRASAVARDRRAAVVDPWFVVVDHARGERLPARRRSR